MLDKRFNMLLSEILDEKLATLAKKYGVSKGEIIRIGIEMLDKQMKDEEREE